MAKFVLEPGEEIMHDVRLDTVREGVIVEVRVILTDRRIALIPHKRLGRAWAFFLPFYAWLVTKSLATTGRVSHQIRRDNVASIEATGPRTVRVTSRGDGYGKVWFELIAKDRDGWLDELGTWAGIKPAVPA